MSDNVVFVTVTEIVTANIPTGSVDTSSSQSAKSLFSTPSDVASVSRVSSISSSTAGAATTIPAITSDFTLSTPSSTFTSDPVSPNLVGNNNSVQSLALAAIILIALLYLFVIVAFILFWLRKECQKCQSLTGQLRGVLKQPQVSGSAERDLESQSKSSSRRSFWPGHPKSSKGKQHADSLMEGFGVTAVDVSYPPSTAVRKNTTEMLHSAADAACTSEEGKDPFRDPQALGSSPHVGFVPYDKFVNTANSQYRSRPYSCEAGASTVKNLRETDKDATSVKLHRGFDSDSFDSDSFDSDSFDSDSFYRASFLGKRISPPQTLAVNGLAKTADGRHRIESRERVKLDLVRDSQGVWNYVPSQFPPLAAPRTDG
jgi:hypothetical protein